MVSHYKACSNFIEMRILKNYARDQFGPEHAPDPKHLCIYYDSSVSMLLRLPCMCTNMRRKCLQQSVVMTVKISPVDRALELQALGCRFEL